MTAVVALLYIISIFIFLLSLIVQRPIPLLFTRSIGKVVAGLPILPVAESISYTALPQRLQCAGGEEPLDYRDYTKTTDFAF